ncbi:MAG: ROK family protein [Lentisphaeria bacterium]|nr:ROK family protein [Candidatus Neomarinimicrobiota bacterium]MCF7842244.1 ROK family protein [Lentisphaeria bacterium]
MTKVRVGIDLGGTKARIGVVDEAGKLLTLGDKIFVKDFTSATVLVKALVKDIQKILRTNTQWELAGIGIGSPGPLDKSRRRVLNTPNLKLLAYFDLVKAFAGHFSQPVVMNNDANVFTLGEALYGAGRGMDVVYGMTLGTGFGNGLVWRGEIFDGAHGVATEYGLAPYAEDVVEHYVSGRALERYYKDFTNQKLSGAEIFKLAEGEDELAIRAFKLLGYHLGKALIPVVRLIDPKMMIIGGSLAAGFPWIYEAAWPILKDLLWDEQEGSLELVPAKLGDAAPVIGAAALIPSGMK